MVNINKIKELAKERGIKLGYLIDNLGLTSRTYFNDIKKRNGDIPNERLAIIAQKLGTTVEYLRDETEVKNVKDYYDELSEYLEMLRDRPETRMLCSLMKEATKKEVKQTIAIIEALRKSV